MPTEVLRNSNQSETIRLSVVVPTYNRGPVLIKCLVALQKQCLQRFEAIVVDNGPSQDDTRERVLELAQSDPRIVYVLTSNKGDFIARNIGCQIARSELLLTIDDDWIMTDSSTLKYIVECFESDDRLGVLGLSSDYSDYWSEPRWKRQLRKGQSVLRRPGTVSRWGRVTARFFDLDPGRRYIVDHVRSCCMAFRRSAGAQLGFFPTLYVHEGDGFRAETEFCVRMQRIGYTVEFSTELVGLHLGARRGAGVIGRQRTAKNVQHLARNHTLFTLRNFWNRPTSLLFLGIDVLVGNRSQPGLLRAIPSLVKLGKGQHLVASIRGKWSGFSEYKRKYYEINCTH